MKKRRTRQHIIADLGFNYVERQVLKAGYVMHKVIFDYGFDGFISTFDTNGEIESGEIYVQVKSTDKALRVGDNKLLAYDLSVRDLELWLLNPCLVLLLLYDARNETAYYLNLQDYFRENRVSLRDVRKFVRVYIPLTNQFNPPAIIEQRNLKNAFTR